MIRWNTSRSLMVRTGAFVFALLLGFLVSGGQTRAEVQTWDHVAGHVTASNVSNVAFSVTWITASDVTGQVEYSTSAADLPGSGTTVDDERGATTSDDTHSVAIGGLTPDTTFFFDVISGGVRDDNNGAHYQVTTGPTLGPPPTGSALGQVKLSDGTTDAVGCLVYFKIASDAKESQLISGLTTDFGGGNVFYNVPTGGARLLNLSGYFNPADTDNVDITAQCGADGVGSASADYSVVATAPPTITVSIEFTSGPVTVTNVSNVAFSVTWTTSINLTGQVEFSTSAVDLPGSGTTVEDERGAATTDDTHSMAIGGLPPDTTFFFDVISGGERDDNSGAHYQVATGPTLGPPPTGSALGRVKLLDGTTDAVGCLVYFTIAGDAKESQLISGLTTDFGGGNVFYNVPIGGARLLNLSGYFNPAGTDVVEIKADCEGDGTGSASADYSVVATAPPTITVEVITTLPPVADDQAVAAEEDTSVDITLTGSAPESTLEDCELIFSIVSGPANGSLGAITDFDCNEAGDEDSALVTYEPDADFNGSDSFDFQVVDGLDVADVGTVTVTVDAVADAPVAGDDTVTTDEDVAVTIDVLANDIDADGDALTVTNLTQPTNGSVSVNVDEEVIYTPDPNFHGADTFTYTAHDGGSDSGPASVNVTVTSINDPPVAADDTATALEDTPVTIDVLANDNDEEGGDLTVTNLTQPTNGSVSVNVDEKVTYTPDTSFLGSDTFTYTAFDGADASNVATVTVDVMSSVPPVAKGLIGTTDEDSAVLVVLTGEAPESTLDDCELIFSIVSGPANGSLGVINDFDCDASGDPPTDIASVTYTPDADFNGSDSFDFQVEDELGVTGVGTVTLTVNAVPDAPVATSDTATTDEDVAVTIDVLANDADADGESLFVTNLVQPAGGSVAVNADEAVTYTPDGDFNGTDTFTYTAFDGTDTSNVATVTVTVDPVNDDPVAVGDTATTLEDTAVNVPVLANDTDVDGDTLAVQFVLTAPNGLAVANQDGVTVDYTPDPDFNGEDSFQYILVDGAGGTDTGTVVVMVVAVNDAPVALDDQYDVISGLELVVDAAAGVLLNDSDVDGDTLTAVIVQSVPAGEGSLVLNLDGSFSYDPGAFTENTSFAYSASDGQALSQPATVLLIQPPAFLMDVTARTVDEGVSTFDVTITLRNPDRDGAVSTVVFATEDGTATATQGDFEPVAATVISLNVDDDTAVIEVTVNDDDIDEPDETLLLTLFSQSADAVIADPEVEITITDNDDEPALYVIDQTANEGDGTVQVMVKLVGRSSEDVSVDVEGADGTAAAPDDYSAVPATLTWTAESTDPYRNFVVTLENDSIEEDAETVIIVLSNATGGVTGDVGEPGVTVADGTGVLALMDNEPAVKVVTVTSQGEALEGDQYWVVIAGMPSDISGLTAISEVPAIVRKMLGLDYVRSKATQYVVFGSAAPDAATGDLEWTFNSVSNSGGTTATSLVARLRVVGARSNRSFYVFPGSNLMGLGLSPEDSSVASLLDQHVANVSPEFIDALKALDPDSTALDRDVADLEDVLAALWAYGFGASPEFISYLTEDPITGTAFGDTPSLTDLEEFQGMIVNARDWVTTENGAVAVFDYVAVAGFADMQPVPIRINVVGAFLKTDAMAPVSQQLRIGFNLLAPHIWDDAPYDSIFAGGGDPLTQLYGSAFSYERAVMATSATTVQIIGRPVTESASIPGFVPPGVLKPQLAYWIHVAGQLGDSGPILTPTGPSVE